MTDVIGTCVPSSWVIWSRTTIDDGLLGGNPLLAVHRIAYLCFNQLIILTKLPQRLCCVSIQRCERLNWFNLNHLRVSKCQTTGQPETIYLNLHALFEAFGWRRKWMEIWIRDGSVGVAYREHLRFSSLIISVLITWQGILTNISPDSMKTKE